ncbi:KH domain-containing protein [Phosphitispora sp. TUW77]|uniref:KH domain-containing protein n=1 Tax=Phosphitispora sp. TUW77 TaxID=3152361 RepID=UPI003AB516D4
MKELVEFLAKSLVDNPEEVTVDVVEGDKTVVLKLKVTPDDMGKVIGKQGKIAKAIRTIAKAAASRKGKKITVEIV